MGNKERKTARAREWRSSHRLRNRQKSPAPGIPHPPRETPDISPLLGCPRSLPPPGPDCRSGLIHRRLVPGRGGTTVAWGGCSRRPAETLKGPNPAPLVTHCPCRLLHSCYVTRFNPPPRGNRCTFRVRAAAASPHPDINPLLHAPASRTCGIPERRICTRTTRTLGATMAHLPAASLPDPELTFGRKPSRSSQPLTHFHVGFRKASNCRLCGGMKVVASGDL
jgi:hypothetical protein